MKQVMTGFLNNTLKELKAITGRPVSEPSAKLIMKGILGAIKDDVSKAYFKNYCKENYSISL